MTSAPSLAAQFLVALDADLCSLAFEAGKVTDVQSNPYERPAEYRDSAGNATSRRRP